VYYVEFIDRDRTMPVDIFRVLGDQATSWAEGAVDRMVLQLGRTMRIGPHPSYLALWRIPDIGRLDAWEEYFSSDVYLKGNPRSHAMHRAINIARAGLYDAPVEDGTEREGLHYVEYFDSAAPAEKLVAWFRERARAGNAGRLAYVLRRIGFMGPDPGHLAVWTFPSYEALEPFARVRPAEDTARLVHAGVYRWLGQEIL